MKRLLCLLLCSLNALFLQAQTKPDSTLSTLTFVDAANLQVINKYHKEPNYNRLPAQYKDKVRKEVWSLSLHSAGIAVRFRSNASTIGAKWKLKNNARMNHMAYTGIKGLDLYALVGNQWQFVNSAIPNDTHNNERVILSNADTTMREYMLYLPLYDGVDSVSIGVNKGAKIEKTTSPVMMAPKPIVYYGSSIAQGGCASRTGMAFTSILSRKVQTPLINLGFSGNGMIEAPIGEAMTEIDAALYIVDCNPNAAADVIYERTIALVKQIRAKKPNTPILLVEGFLYETGYFNKAIHPIVQKKRTELTKAFQTLQKAGVKGITYCKADGFIGTDHEGTVDGIHPTDVGMERIAAGLLPVVKKLLGK
ncbi:SGNH-like hydrolase/esterase family protein [Chitinophaga skermanii]|uniref:SGNH-like hydrolase/esterase family protein n=1 Tax=Chitinophaga skermanii TaxID=331697 RepID=A0A327QTP3_9BACT|nr:SGNH/GDSL hydrolase family protein [Chitinophaga skermanii]RAJ06773.1 SGNH-like hydrolase/esterase family protein [Chitinophaga skermanii]